MNSCMQSSEMQADLNYNQRWNGRVQLVTNNCIDGLAMAVALYITLTLKIARSFNHSVNNVAYIECTCIHRLDLYMQEGYFEGLH